MNKLILFLSGMWIVGTLSAQSELGSPPSGFDEVRSGIPQGKIDTLSYTSETVGTTRKALIYTPRVIPQIRNTRCCICFTELEVTKRNG
jgi:hypothetical protein